MHRILEKSVYIVLVGVIATLLASVTAFLWGGYKTGLIIDAFLTSGGKDPLAAIGLIELMDVFLIATALLMFSLGMYELFIRDIALPQWLVVKDLQDLKSKLGSVIILVLAVTFLSHLVQWRDPQGTFYFGLAVSLVSLTLIAFLHFGKH